MLIIGGQAQLFCVKLQCALSARKRTFWTLQKALMNETKCLLQCNFELSEKSRTRIAQYLYPVRAVAFEKSLIKVKDRVRGKEQIHDLRVKRHTPHNIADHEKLLRKFSWLPWTLFNVYLIDIVAKHDIHAGGDDLGTNTNFKFKQREAQT